MCCQGRFLALVSWWWSGHRYLSLVVREKRERGDMPSESAKKRQAQKKERERQRHKQASAKRNQQKVEHENGASPGVNGDEGACAASVQPPEEETRVKSKPVDKKAAARSCTGKSLPLYNSVFVVSYFTGVLSSHHLSRDIQITRLSITFHGVELLSDTQLELNCGRRYGLVGLNGSGEVATMM